MDQLCTIPHLKKFLNDIKNESKQDEFLIRKLIIERVIDYGIYDNQNRNQLELNFEENGTSNKTFVTINRYIPGPLFMKYYNQVQESVANFRQQSNEGVLNPKLMALKKDPEENNVLKIVFKLSSNSQGIFL